jgi:hypothetical protein
MGDVSMADRLDDERFSGHPRSDATIAEHETEPAPRGALPAITILLTRTTSEENARIVEQLTLAGFWRQRFSYGSGRIAFITPAERGGGPFCPEFSFYRNVFGHPFRAGP